MSFFPLGFIIVQIYSGLRKGWSCLDGRGRQLLRSKISEWELLSTLGGKLPGESNQGEEEEKVKERTCIKCQMGLSLDFSNYFKCHTVLFNPPWNLNKQGSHWSLIYNSAKRRGFTFQPKCWLISVLFNENTEAEYAKECQVPISLRITVSLKKMFTCISFFLISVLKWEKKKIYGHSHTLTKVSEYIQPNFKEYL